MSSISKLWRKLRNKAYRDGYTEAQLSIEMPFQIRAIRKERGWTQAQLAERSGIPQARISHIEQPGRDPLSLRTLYRLAAAFDVGLLVQFVPFSELVHREALFNPETFRVPNFEKDQLEGTVSTSIEYFKTELNAQTEVFSNTSYIAARKGEQIWIDWLPSYRSNEEINESGLTTGLTNRLGSVPFPIAPDNNFFFTGRTPYE